MRNTLGPGLWRETLKNVKNKNCTLQDMVYGKKTDQKGKSETHMVRPGVWRETLKNVQNEKHTLQDMDCGEKTENREKFDTHTVGTGIWQENRQTRKMRNSPCRI